MMHSMEHITQSDRNGNVCQSLDLNFGASVWVMEVDTSDVTHQVSITWCYVSQDQRLFNPSMVALYCLCCSGVNLQTLVKYILPEQYMPFGT